MKRRSFAVHTAASLAAFSGFPSRAQEKTYRILVGFPAGGAIDAIARLLADKMRGPLGHTIVVENKPGAGGRLAMFEAKRASPDGTTVVLAASSVMVLQPWYTTNLGYDPVRDFTPIARVSTNDFVLTAGPSAPPGNVQALLAWMKANPDQATYAHSGAGTTPYFVGQMLARATGVKLTDVPYRGGAPAVIDLQGGQIPLMIDTATETIEYHKAGKVRILAVTGDRRAKVLPDIPTLREMGIDVLADAFLGLYGPPKMPAEVVTRISNAVAEVLQMPDVQGRIYSYVLVPSYGNASELMAMQAEQLKRWEAPIKASGFKLD